MAIKLRLGAKAFVCPGMQSLGRPAARTIIRMKASSLCATVIRRDKTGREKIYS
jgi:hypothetical protein